MTSARDPLLVSSFSSDDVMPKEVFDAYHAYIAPARLTDLEPSSGWSRRPKASARVWDLGQMRALHGAHSGLRLSRPGPSARRSPPEMVSIQRYIGGQSSGISADMPYRLNCNVLSIADAACHLRAESEGRVEFFTITLPYEAIGYDPSVHASIRTISVHSPVGRLVDSAIKTIIEQLDRADPEATKLMASAFAGMLRGLLIGKDNPDVRLAIENYRDRSVKQYVLRNLQNANLSVELVCVELSISRATLYRVFKADGGFRRFVTARRLAGAMKQLKHSTPYRGLVGYVSANWCFSDPSDFSKPFKREFGVAPSEVVEFSPSERLRQIANSPELSAKVH